MFNFAKKTLSSIASGPDDDEFPDADLEDNSPEAIEERQRQDLHARIIALWQKVWLGLYQVHNNSGPYHNDRLKALYLGAGMSNRNQEDDDALNLPERRAGLGLLHVALSRHLYSAFGIRSLKLYDGLSLGTLKSVIEILEAYEREIEPLGEVYAVLRRLQIGLREPTKDDEDAVLQQYPPVADPIAKRLLQYDARLSVLGMDLYDEAMSLHDPKLRRSWLVEDAVFPRLRNASFFKSSR